MERSVITRLASVCALAGLALTGSASSCADRAPDPAEDIGSAESAATELGDFNFVPADLGCQSTISIDTQTQTLWPPNHKMATFHLSDCASVSDRCDPSLDVDAAGAITFITSDEVEDANGNGDGHTCNDIVIDGPSTFRVRAEREGTSNGRVYSVYFAVTDKWGTTSQATCHIQVPHDQGGDSEAVEDHCHYCVAAQLTSTCAPPGLPACAQHHPACTY